MPFPLSQQHFAIPTVEADAASKLGQPADYQNLYCRTRGQGGGGRVGGRVGGGGGRITANLPPHPLISHPPHPPLLESPRQPPPALDIRSLYSIVCQSAESPTTLEHKAYLKSSPDNLMSYNVFWPRRSMICLLSSAKPLRTGICSRRSYTQAKCLADVAATACNALTAL